MECQSTRGFPYVFCRASEVVVLMVGVVFVTVISAATGRAERVSLEPGEQLAVRLDETISTKDHYFGPIIEATLDQDVDGPNGQVAIPAGSGIKMAMAEFKRAGHVIGRSAIRLRLYSVVLPGGTEVPLDGYPTHIERGAKPNREGTFHGHRGWIKDGAFETTAVAIGAGAGFAVGGPLALATGAGAGLLTAGLWYIIRRGPDLVLPAGTVIVFALTRPVSFNVADDPPSASFGYSDPASDPQGGVWGQGLALPPSADLASMLSEVNQPTLVLARLAKLNFRDRSTSDQVFATYLRGLCEWRLQKPKKALDDFEQAYSGAKRLNFPLPAQEEIAMNLVIALRATSKNWATSPLMNDPELQAVLVRPAGE